MSKTKKAKAGKSFNDCIVRDFSMTITNIETGEPMGVKEGLLGVRLHNLSPNNKTFEFAFQRVFGLDGSGFQAWEGMPSEMKAATEAVYVEMEKLLTGEFFKVHVFPTHKASGGFKADAKNILNLIGA